MKVLFLNPPFLGKFSREQRSPAITKSGTIYYPMWLAYCAGLVQKRGHEILLIDAPADGLWESDVMARAKAFSPHIIVCSTSTPSIFNDVDIASRVKGESGAAHLILVGPHVSALDEETLALNETIDAIARREYEYTVAEFCDAVAQGLSLDTVEGLTYRHHGEIVRNGDRQFLTDLDSLPFVSQIYQQFLTIEHYFSSIALHPQITLITGRGCPYQCKYCVYPQTQMGHQYRYRSLDNVLQELQYIQYTFPQVKEIFFEDDTLTANATRCRDFCKQLIEQRMNISWVANSRADIDEETLTMMKQAGCRLLCVGVESGSQEILDTMGKRLTLDQVRRFFKACKKLGILVHGCFMVGNPGETRETMETTLAFAKELNPDTAQFFPIMVYPGTHTYEWAKAHHYLDTKDFSQWLTPEGLHNCVVSTDKLSARDLVTFCDQARRQFYLRPVYLYRKLTQVVRSPSERKRTLKSAAVFFKYLFR